MSTLFEVTASEFFERTLKIQRLFEEEVDSLEEVMNNYVLVNKQYIVEFINGSPQRVGFKDLPEDIKQVIVMDHIEKL